MTDKNTVVMLDITSIKVVNPRLRNRHIHDEITQNIRAVGLKKPITVREINKDKDKFEYALICGQGRLESFIALGQSKIPAIIKTVDEHDGQLMSLVENIARRNPRATELLERVKDMIASGLSDVEVAARLGYSVQWVNDITMLYDKGEKKLLSAVETGNIPLHTAVAIARADKKEVQELLMEAFNANILNQKKLTIVRNILKRREEGNKGTTNLEYTPKRKQKKLTPEELLKIYQDDVDEHKAIQTKTEFVSESLRLINEIFHHLLKNKDFIELLTTEKLNNIPAKIIKNAILYKG